MRIASQPKPFHFWLCDVGNARDATDIA